MLEGRKSPLKNSYFATKLLSQEDLAQNYSYTEARRREAKFFESTSPWNSLPPVSRARIGVGKLTAALSKKLVAYISDKSVISPASPRRREC